MSTPAPDPPSFSSALQQLSSLLSLSQQIRAHSDTGQPLSRLDIVSKLDTLGPIPSPSSPAPPGTPSTPFKSPGGDLTISADSGLAMTASFSSLYESDESVFSPFPHARNRRSNRALNLRTPPNRKPRPGSGLSPREEEEMRLFLQTVSSEFCNSLRALLAVMSREVTRDEIVGSGSDVTLPELECKESVSEDMNQLRERNAYLVNACRELKARVREERREGRRVRKENTSLSLERGGLLAKMSETEREIIEKMGEHTCLMEAYAELEERVKERERSVKEKHSQIAAMEVEVNKLNALLSRVEHELSESRHREEEKQRENSHLREELVMKGREREVMELKSAAERVHSHARLLSAMEGDIDSSPAPSHPHTYTVGLVSTDKILEEAASLCEQLNQLTELFTAGSSHSLSQIRAGLSHARADGTLLLRNITALKSEHERCKDALFLVQMGERGYDAPSPPVGGADLLTRIAEIAPRITLDAEMLAEQWDEMNEGVDAAKTNAILTSHLRAIIGEHMGVEVPEALITSLTALLSPRKTSAPCPKGAGLEGMLQESSLLLNNMSEALTCEQLKRHSQMRALKRRTERDNSTLRRVKVECEGARRGEQLVRQALSCLFDNLCQAEECEVRLCEGIREESVRQVADRVDRLLMAGYSKKLSDLKERLVSAVSSSEQARKVLEFQMSENERLSAEVRLVRMNIVELEGVKSELEREVSRQREVEKREREESGARESLLATKLGIVQEHIELYDTVMFRELDKLSAQVKDDKVERDLQLKRDDEVGEEVVRKLKKRLANRDKLVNFLQKEIGTYEERLWDLELKLGNVGACVDVDMVEESEKKVHFSEDLPSPSPYPLPPVTPLRGEELQTALGVALSQEKLYARAHLSLQTERDQLAEENKQLRDRLNSIHQRISDPLGLIPSRPASSPAVTPTVVHAPAEKRLEIENAGLTTQITELSSKLGRLENYRHLYTESKNKVKSLLWQKSYLKSQLNVYFSSLRVSALILTDLGVGADKIGMRGGAIGRSKFRVYVWVVIFIVRLSHFPQNQPNFIYLDYTPSNSAQIPFFRF